MAERQFRGLGHRPLRPGRKATSWRARFGLPALPTPCLVRSCPPCPAGRGSMEEGAARASSHHFHTSSNYLRSSVSVLSPPTTLCPAGRGSVKEGASRDPKYDYGEDEELHVLITGERQEDVSAGEECVLAVVCVLALWGFARKGGRGAARAHHRGAPGGRGLRAWACVLAAARTSILGACEEREGEEPHVLITGERQEGVKDGWACVLAAICSVLGARRARIGRNSSSATARRACTCTGRRLC